MKIAENISSRLKLSDGREIPLLGLGVWQIPNGKDTFKAINWAFDDGYRHIDTAKIYRNETSVGEAVRKSKIDRSSIWISTKLWTLDITNASKALDESLERLGLEYVDLYLIHWPVPGLEKRSWKAMEKLCESGRAKSIGVSNYSPAQLERVLSVAHIPPVLNQIKLSPFNYNESVHDFHLKHNIAIEAYSPLTVGHKLQDKELTKLAQKHKRTTAQILLRWGVQKNFIIIPRSSNKAHIKENTELFDFSLDDNDINELDSYSKFFK